MALDTALKRMSAMNCGMPWRTVLPFPDGTIDATDRLVLGGMYAGVAADDTPYFPPELIAPIDSFTIYHKEAMTPVNLTSNFDSYVSATPITYSITSGALPNGLTLTATGEFKGIISGTPLASGVFTLVATLTDGQGGLVSSNPFTVTVTRNPETPSKARKGGFGFGFGFDF